MSSGNLQFYVMEVARPDDWSISTLILQPQSQTSQTTIKIVEQVIKQLLDGLVLKSGHWDQNALNQCKGVDIQKLKHYQSDTALDWAFRLAGKLIC